MQKSIGLTSEQLMTIEQNSFVVERPWSLGGTTTWNATGEMKTCVMEKPTGVSKTCGRRELGGTYREAAGPPKMDGTRRSQKARSQISEAIWQVAALRKSVLTRADAIGRVWQTDSHTRDALVACPRS